MMTESTATSAGLKGVVAGRSSICLIDGEQGLLAYRGYDIHDLAKHSTFEETTYLLRVSIPFWIVVLGS